MYKASIDIGSNSVLLLVLDVEGSQFKIVKNLANITGLGRGIDTTKLLSDEAMAETFDVLKNYAEICKSLNIDPEDVCVTATEASRVAHNAKDFYQAVQTKLKLKVEIISGAQEAFYTASGIALGTDKKDFVVMDIGGASTELMLLKNKKLTESFSMPVGCVRAKEWNDFNRVSKVLDDFDFSNYQTDTLVCDAGTMTSIGAVYRELKEYGDELVHGVIIDFSDYEKFVEKLFSINEEALLAKYPYLGKRAYVLKYGAKLALLIGAKLGTRHFEVSSFGLRYGTILSK